MERPRKPSAAPLGAGLAVSVGDDEPRRDPLRCAREGSGLGSSSSSTPTSSSQYTTSSSSSQVSPVVSPLKLNSISDLNAIDETRTARELATNRGAAAATNFRSDPLNAVWEPEKLSVALANVPATLVSDTDRSADTTTRPAGSAAAGAARSRAPPFEATPMTAAPAAAPAVAPLALEPRASPNESRASRMAAARRLRMEQRASSRHSAYSPDSKSVLLRGSDATHLTPRVSESQLVRSASLGDRNPSWSSSSSLLGGRLSAGSAASPGSPARAASAGGGTWWPASAAEEDAARASSWRHEPGPLERAGSLGSVGSPGAPALSPQYAAAAARRGAPSPLARTSLSEEGDEPPPGDSFGSQPGSRSPICGWSAGAERSRHPSGDLGSAISRLSPP